MSKTYQELMKERNKLSAKIKREMTSVRIYSKYGGNKSKLRNEANIAFYGTVESDLFKKKTFESAPKAGQKLYTEQELMSQINQMKELLEDKETFVNSYNSISDDTVISWKDNNYDDDKNHIFMKDIQEQWDSAGQAGDDSDYPTWISVFNIFGKGANESITVGDIKEKMLDNSISADDRNFLRTLYNQINNTNTYFKGRI